MLYSEIKTPVWAQARERGRDLIAAGLFTGIKEDGLIVGVEPTEDLLKLFHEPPPTVQLFDALARFAQYHWLFPESANMQKATDDLLALGMIKGESGTIWKAIRKGQCVPG